MTLLVAMLFAAAEVAEFEEKSIFELAKCHAGDVSLVYIEPVIPGTNQLPGFFQTTNAVLTWAQICIAPEGTNKLFSQTVCAGKTGALSSARLFTVRRTPPPPVIKFRKKPLLVDNVTPPLPFGFPTQPLPGGKNIEYKDRLKTEAEKIGLNPADAVKFKLHRSQ